MSVKTYRTNYDYLHSCSSYEMAEVLTTILIGIYEQCTDTEMTDEFIELNKIALAGWLESPVIQGRH